MSTLHQELFPAFYSDVQTVELPELSWQDVENLAAKDDEPEQVPETQQPEPEPDADSGRCRSAFRAHGDHSFRAISISDSGGCRSLIPG